MRVVSSRLTKKRVLMALAVAVISGILCCTAFQFSAFNSIQQHTGDLLFSTTNAEQDTGSSEKIVVIAIDDKSLNELGKISLWPRRYYASLVDSLSQSKARVIVFDVLFAEPSPDDSLLAASMKTAGNVIIPIAAASGLSSSEMGSNAGQKDFLHPVPELAASAASLGHAEVLMENDGTVRDLALFTRDGSDSTPSLSLAAVAGYLRRTGTIENSVGEGLFSFAGRSIPVKNDNQMIINYMPGQYQTGAGIFTMVSFADVLNNRVDGSIFEDKIAVIGATASGFGDSFWTPLGKKLNGVEIHASAINTILSGRFLKHAEPVVYIALILLVSLLCGLIVLCFQPLLAVILNIVLGLSCIVVSSICFQAGIILNPFYPLLALLCSFVGMSLYNAIWERAQRNAVERLFGRYVSPSVSNRILAAMDSGGLKLDGEEQQITVAFADIRGFTEMTHSVKTQALVRALNGYLSVLIEAVNKNQGIVNKFNGDGIMAIWNVPAACENHRLMAVKAACDAQQGIRELQIREPSLLKMNFGIGISTGKAVCGNLGCRDRLEYSAIGSTVNLASRITAVAPAGSVLVSQDLYDSMNSCVEAEYFGEVMLKGEKEPLKLYQIARLTEDTAMMAENTKSGHPFKSRLAEIFKKQKLVFESASMKSGTAGG